MKNLRKLDTYNAINYKTTLFLMSFFYNSHGDNMTIYLDLVFIINISFDFLLLLCVDLVLKRKAKLIKLILGSTFGTISLLFLFLPLTSITLFLLKVILSVIMIVITFGYKDIKYFINNIITLYLSSILLGGFLYYLNITFSYKQEGLAFFYKGLSINFIFLLVISPIVIYFYIKQSRELRSKYSNYYFIKIIFKDLESLIINAYLDTGNFLSDPVTKKRIIIVDNSIIDDKYKVTPYYIPYHSLNHKTLLKCISIKEIEVEGLGKTKNVLLGISDTSIGIDGVGAILNNQIMEELK